MPPIERLTTRRDDPGGQDADGGRLPGTVRAEQAEDLAGPDPEVEPVDGPEVRSRVGLGQTDRLDDRRPVAAGVASSGVAAVVVVMAPSAQYRPV